MYSRVSALNDRIVAALFAIGVYAGWAVTEALSAVPTACS